jgi:hypothetical protein
MPNGTDFWWDNFPNSKGNCWYGNRGPNPITTSPSSLPDCDNGKDPESSTGTGSPSNEGELLQCFVAFESGAYDPAVCPWFETPPKPGTEAARAARREQRAAARRALFGFCGEMSSHPTCEAFGPLPPLD